MSCESSSRVQVLYFKCGCAARVVIIEDFSYMHTVGHHKRLLLAHEEGDPTKCGAGSGSGWFRHKLSPAVNSAINLL